MLAACNNLSQGLAVERRVETVMALDRNGREMAAGSGSVLSRSIRTSASPADVSPGGDGGEN